MRVFLLLLFCIAALMGTAQDITGLWETYDDETKEKKALVEIVETDGIYSAQIRKTFTAEPNAICDKCKGAKKDKPLVGLTIIENIKKDGEEYNDGTILDPENGKVYKCFLRLADDGRLQVRGFIGFAVIGRTQYWSRPM